MKDKVNHNHIVIDRLEGHIGDKYFIYPNQHSKIKERKTLKGFLKFIEDNW